MRNAVFQAPIGLAKDPKVGGKANYLKWLRSLKMEEINPSDLKTFICTQGIKMLSLKYKISTLNHVFSSHLLGLQDFVMKSGQRFLEQGPC